MLQLSSSFLRYAYFILSILVVGVMTYDDGTLLP